MNVIEIYESGSTDGYKHFGDNKYFLNESMAKAYAKNKHGNYCIDPIKHFAINAGDEKYYLLKSESPINLANSEAEKLKIKESALSKLSSEEREILGV